MLLQYQKMASANILDYKKPLTQKSYNGSLIKFTTNLFAVLDWNSATLLFRDFPALLVSYLAAVWFRNVSENRKEFDYHELLVYNSGVATYLQYRNMLIAQVYLW